MRDFEIKDGLILKTRCGRFERNDDKNLEKINKGSEKKMKQLSFRNDIDKMSSASNKSGVQKVKDEALREAKMYHNNVNENLTKNNIVLLRNDKILENQFNNCILKPNQKDVILVDSSLADGSLVNKAKVSSHYVLTREQWKNYFEENLEVVQNELGENAKCVYAAVHFDEFKPHMQSMFVLQRKREKKAVYDAEDIDMNKVDGALQKRFSRFNKKNNITKKNFNVDKKYKNWEEYQQEFYDKNREIVIQKQIKKKNNDTDTRDYEFPTRSVRLNYREINQNITESLKNNEVVKKYKSNMKMLVGEKIEIVANLDKQLTRKTSASSVKTQIEEDNKNLIKEFAKDYSKKDEVFEKFHLQQIKEEMLNISAEEYDKKVQKIQKLIKKRDTAEHVKNIMLSYTKVKTMIVNEAVKILPNNDFVKLKQILDKDEKRYGSLVQQNKELNDTRENFKEMKNNMTLEQAKHKTQKDIWEKEEQEQKAKRQKWNLESKEHQKNRENWNKEKNELEQEKENLEAEIQKSQNEISNLKTQIKEKTETAKNELKKDGEIQKEALSAAIKELYQEYKNLYNNNEKIKETAKNEATKELKENNKTDKEIIEKARTEAHEDYKQTYVLPPKIIEKIEKKVEKEKYEEILEDKDGKYTNSAKKKALHNKEFAKKIIKKATDEKKAELEKNPQKITEIITEIKHECFVNPAKLKDSAILAELKKDWGLRTQVRDSLKKDKNFKEQVMNEIKSDEKMEIATNYVKNDMNSNEKINFLRNYIDSDKIRNYMTKDELEKAEKEAKNEVLGEIKTENVILYQNILHVADFFYNFYKKFIEEELKSRFENTNYELIYSKGIRTTNSNIFDKVIKSFCRIVNFFGIKNQYKKYEEKNEIKDELEDLKQRLEIKENDSRNQNKAF